MNIEKEMYMEILRKITDIRRLCENLGLEFPIDKSILEAYENLAAYVIENFEIPSENKDYICKQLFHNKSITYSTPVKLVEELKKHNINLKEGFDIELPLRGIENYFTWGVPKDIELESLLRLKYLIAKLHALVGDKYYTKIKFAH